MINQWNWYSTTKRTKLLIFLPILYFIYWLIIVNNYPESSFVHEGDVVFFPGKLPFCDHNRVTDPKTQGGGGMWIGGVGFYTASASENC